jgi:hypothetical protein
MGSEPTAVPGVFAAPAGDITILLRVHTLEGAELAVSRFVA